MTKIEKEFNFRNTKENGKLAGTTQRYEVAEFNWENYKNVPNARLFAERNYYSVVQKLVRDILLEKNGTSLHHLQSIESVITRSIKFTKKDIIDWCGSRNWEKVAFKMESSRATDLLKEKLPLIALDEIMIDDENIRKRMAEIIASVSDLKTDPIAEYLWVKLTQEPKEYVSLESL